MPAALPLSLYVHLPWCVRKCPYCDFNSYAAPAVLPEARYVEALEADLEAQAPHFAGRLISSAFFGGGTPSLFSPAAIGRVLESARRHFRMAPDAEITLEANPGTVERGRFAEYRAAGINRVSLGAQSFDDEALRTLGRIHTAAETREAAAELHAAGVENFNLDLMYGLPGQDEAGAIADVAAALALAPAHISHYQLTLEAGTLFAARPPRLPDDESVDAMLDACQERFAAHGFARYEVSAYAAPGRRCAHNLNYWQFGDYVGVGAGAHGKRTEPGNREVIRTAHVREPRRYLASAAHGPAARTIPPADLPFEYMLNALRLVEGFELPEFSARTGMSGDVLAPTLESLQARGLLTHEGQRWQASPLGLRFLNDVLAAFLPPEPERMPPAGLSTSDDVDGARYAQAPQGGTANESITCESPQVAG